MIGTSLVLLPPFLVLAYSIVTSQVTHALIIGIVSAVIIAGQFSPWAMLDIIRDALWQQVDIVNVYSLGFLISIGIFMALLNVAGGAHAYSLFLQKRFTTRRSVQGATVAAAFFFAIDDFFSCVTVGCMMRPVTDHVKIARAKLAFILDSLAAPLVILVPYSSWIAMLISQIDKSGIALHSGALLTGEPLQVFLRSIPYIFYSHLTIASVVFIVTRHISFGPMRQHEQIALEEDNLFGGKESVNDLFSPTDISTKSSVADFLAPIGVFVGVIMGGLILLIAQFGITGIDQMTIFKLFFYGGFIAVGWTALFLLVRSRISLSHIPLCLANGFEMMRGSIILLLLAWIFGELLRSHLGTGDYIATLVAGSVAVCWLPLIFFLVAFMTALGIGSSWGTIALVLPVAIPLLVKIIAVSPGASVDSVEYLFPLLGAVFSGAVAGDHLSPVSGTSIMTATGAQTYLTDHVWTQFWYALPALVITILTYASFYCFSETVLALPIRLGGALIVTFITLQLIGSKQK